MSDYIRQGYVYFCVVAKAEIDGEEIIDIDPLQFINLSDDELRAEAHRLNGLLEGSTSVE